MRELREETGLEAELVERLGDTRYSYARGGDRVLKGVRFFLLRHRSGRVPDPPPQVRGAPSIPPDQAPAPLDSPREGGVARAGEQIDFVVNSNQVAPPIPGGPARPAFNFNGSDFWAQGLNFGLEFKR